MLTKIEKYGKFLEKEKEIQEKLEDFEKKQLLEQARDELRDKIKELYSLVNTCLKSGFLPNLFYDNNYFILTKNKKEDELEYIRIKDRNNHPKELIASYEYHLFSNGDIKFTIDSLRENDYESYIPYINKDSFKNVKIDFLNLYQSVKNHIEQEIKNCEKKEQIDKYIDEYEDKLYDEWEFLGMSDIQKLKLRNFIYNTYDFDYKRMVEQYFHSFIDKDNQIELDDTDNGMEI